MRVRKTKKSDNFVLKTNYIIGRAGLSYPRHRQLVQFYLILRPRAACLLWLAASMYHWYVDESPINTKRAAKMHFPGGELRMDEECRNIIAISRRAAAAHNGKVPPLGALGSPWPRRPHTESIKTVETCSTRREEHAGRWNFVLAPSEAKLSVDGDHGFPSLFGTWPDLKVHWLT